MSIHADHTRFWDFERKPYPTLDAMFNAELFARDFTGGYEVRARAW